MAIPGSASTKIEIRAKVRVGVPGDKFPRSVDYFVTEDPEFTKRYPNRVSEVPVVFVHAEPEDVFRTGLEWWRGSVLACYSEDGGNDPTAFRVSGLEVKENGQKKTLSWLDPDDEVRGAPVGRGRTPIKCRFRDCRHFGKHANNKECRVKGRLTFLLPGGQTDSALQLETKSWNTIESISGTLASCRRSGPLNAPGREFLLSVHMEQDGSNRFPVVTVKEVGERVEVNSLAEADLADALVQLRRIVDTEGATEAEIKLRIAAVLDHTNAGWRENPDFVKAMQGRVETLGVVGSALALLKRFETAAAA